MENEIKIPINSKNLFDVGTQINEKIEYIENIGYRVIRIALNEKTLKYLKEKNIYGFKNVYGKEIKTIINNNLLDSQIEIFREKKDKATEYVPYKVKTENVIKHIKSH